MATKTKVPAHLDGARSALSKGGFSTSVAKRGYVVRKGFRLPVDHPVVSAHPDRFQPSGEAPDGPLAGRDLDPPPRPQSQRTRIVYRAVCAGDPACDWTAERDTEAAAVAAPHWHDPA